MKPVAVLQFDPDVPAGYFLQWLSARGCIAHPVAVHRGERVPADASPFAGICLLGGRMSVNDGLPWIGEVCALVRAADGGGVPIIGHCLGGQLLAHALGGRVETAAFREIGWHTAAVTDHDVASAWLPSLADSPVEVFQWHEDRFVPPPGARTFMASALCETQAYVVERPGFAHLGMQFHCEMTLETIDRWCAGFNGPEGHEPGVQCVAEIQHRADERIETLHRVADSLYRRWTCGLKR